MSTGTTEVASGLHSGLVDGDRTVPPSSNLRTAMAKDLYAMTPELAQEVQLSPQEDESIPHMLARLRSSTTPEEAVTFSAFALQPRISVWWGHECLAAMREHLTPIDTQLMEMIGGWAHDPSEANRSAIKAAALGAPSKTPGVWIGLACAASEGRFEDDGDTHTTPRSVNAGVLSCLARGGLEKRSVNLARFINMAQTLVGD